MLIGLDFDNTIVSYDALFHRVAVEQGTVPVELIPTKLAVRDHLRRLGQEDLWTEMQGYVYGARMTEASAYPGLLEFLQWACDERIDLTIISHKTLHPFLGPKYDLHAAARQWVRTHLVRNGVPLVPPDRVYFELTSAEKLGRIAQCGCDFYIDDLPEILLAPAFPKATQKLLFDPDAHHSAVDTARVKSWPEIQSYFEELCRK